MGSDKLCILCCSPLHAEIYDPSKSAATINKFCKQVSVSHKSVCRDNNTNFCSVCSDCLPGVESATKLREKTDDIEGKVNGLQLQIVKLLRDMQQIIGDYMYSLEVIENKIETSQNVAKPRKGKNQVKTEKGPGFESGQLREGILNVLRELHLFQPKLSLRVNGTTDPNDSFPVKIEPAESEDQSEFDDIPSPNWSPTAEELEQEAEEKLDPDFVPITRRTRRSATKATTTRLPISKPKSSPKKRKVIKPPSTKTPKIKREVITSQKPTKITKPSWYTCNRVRYRTNGTGRKRTFLCETCPDFSARNLFHLEHHLRQHELSCNSKDVPKSFNCPHCSLSFSLKQLYEYHVLCHGGVFKSVCDLCNKQYAPLELETHLKEEHGTSKIFQCDNCFFCCSTRETYLEHLRSKHQGDGVIMRCDLCPEVFTTRKDHLEHLYEKHNLIEKLVCDVRDCTKEFLDPWMMKTHKIVHTKPFACLQCDYKAINSQSLETHQLVHTTNRPWKCSKCTRSFKTELALRLHNKRHESDANPVAAAFQCHVCEKAYKQQSSLEAHLRVHQGKGYTCEKCGAVFAFRNAFKIHMEAHNAEGKDDNVFCEYCGKGFRSENYLKRHVERQHVKTEKRYKCTECDKGFTRNSFLKAHLRVHSGEKPYVCNLCEKAFNQSGSLWHHKKLIHGIQKGETTAKKSEPI